MCPNPICCSLCTVQQEKSTFLFSVVSPVHWKIQCICFSTKTVNFFEKRLISKTCLRFQELYLPVHCLPWTQHADWSFVKVIRATIGIRSTIFKKRNAHERISSFRFLSFVCSPIVLLCFNDLWSFSKWPIRSYFSQLVVIWRERETNRLMTNRSTKNSN